MAIIGARLARWRQQQSKKALVISPWRGLLRVSGWPKARGPAKDAYKASIEKQLALVQANYKKLHPREIVPLQDAVTEHNRVNTGIKGSARMRVRDVSTKVMYGTMWALEDQFGNVYYSASVLQAVSDALDWMEPEVGAVPVYINGLWQPTACSVPGSVMTVLPDGNIEGCCPSPTIAQGRSLLMADLTDAERRLQQALDVLSAKPGAIIYRDVDGWRALNPGNLGDVLTISDTLLPSWQPPS